MDDQTKAEIRAAGGIIHADGNIFFTNVEQFKKAAAALSQPSAQGGNAASGLSDWQLRDMGIDPSKRHNQSSVWPFPKPKATP